MGKRVKEENAPADAAATTHAPAKRARRKATPASVVAAIQQEQAEQDAALLPAAPAAAAPKQPAAPKRERGKGAAKTCGDKLYSPAWNTSSFRGVTKHRRSGRWEAHIWIGKGVNKQIYLGGYEKEEHAAEAYDMAALKTKGFATPTNFAKERYRELEGCLDNASLEEVVTAVRRQSQGFSRGTSSFRGVSPHPSGRFEARIGISGNKHVYLGLYNREADAAKAYDQAVVRIKGSQASTNFTLSDYNRELTEHELKQVEIQMPHAFRAMEVAPEARCAAGTALPLPEELEALDLKALSSCSDSDFQKWVRSGYAPPLYETLWRSLQAVHGTDDPVPPPYHPSNDPNAPVDPPAAPAASDLAGIGEPPLFNLGLAAAPPPLNTMAAVPLGGGAATGGPGVGDGWGDGAAGDPLGLHAATGVPVDTLHADAHFASAAAEGGLSDGAAPLHGGDADTAVPPPVADGGSGPFDALGLDLPHDHHRCDDELGLNIKGEWKGGEALSGVALGIAAAPLPFGGMAEAAGVPVAADDLL